ncbi:uncharacterized protein LOC104871652 [Fukomys damarensis]|uniref:uncharacterized protein LOC104871652 n=1 Tax=Fukomys damarensis TaxID=885580 RepID=UPI0005402CF3|nr:uncharacterized protein LOC104871652 [Fukomys damarensis]
MYTWTCRRLFSMLTSSLLGPHLAEQCPCTVGEVQGLKCQFLPETPHVQPKIALSQLSQHPSWGNQKNLPLLLQPFLPWLRGTRGRSGVWLTPQKKFLACPDLSRRREVRYKSRPASHQRPRDRSCWLHVWGRQRGSGGQEVFEAQRNGKGLLAIHSATSEPPSEHMFGSLAPTGTRHQAAALTHYSSRQPCQGGFTTPPAGKGPEAQGGDVT